MPSTMKVCMGLYGLNAERYLHEAIESVITQDFDGVEVVLSDDGSSDRTFEIMQEYACRGTLDRPIKLNRHPARLGIGGQLNSICALTSAEVIVLCGADDRSLPHRARMTYENWIDSGRRAHSITSAAFIMDKDGVRTGAVLPGKLLPGGLLDQVRGRCHGVFGAAQAMSRESWQTFGPFIPRLFLEDNSIAFRALLLDGHSHIDVPLVEYRIHGNNSCHPPGGSADYDAFIKFCTWHRREGALAFAQFIADLNSPAAERLDVTTLDEARRIAADCLGRELLLSEYYRGRLKGRCGRYASSLLERTKDVLKVWLKTRFNFIERRNAMREMRRRESASY